MNLYGVIYPILSIIVPGIPYPGYTMCVCIVHYTVLSTRRHAARTRQVIPLLEPVGRRNDQKKQFLRGLLSHQPWSVHTAVSDLQREQFRAASGAALVQRHTYILVAQYSRYRTPSPPTSQQCLLLVRRARHRHLFSSIFSVSRLKFQQGEKCVITLL